MLRALMETVDEMQKQIGNRNRTVEATRKELEGNVRYKKYCNRNEKHSRWAPQETG